MSLELALVTGLIGAAWITFKTSEKLRKTEEEIAVTVLALSYLPVIGMLYGGFTMAEGGALTGMKNVYIGSLALAVIFYTVFLYIVVKTYKKRIKEEGLDGL